MQAAAGLVLSTEFLAPRLGQLGFAMPQQLELVSRTLCFRWRLPVEARVIFLPGALQALGMARANQLLPVSVRSHFDILPCCF